MRGLAVWNRTCVRVSLRQPRGSVRAGRMKELLNELYSSSELVEVPVTDFGSALAYRFLGSPTVRVNGIDVEPSARGSKQFGVACRTYFDGVKWAGVPSFELIRQALE